MVSTSRLVMGLIFLIAGVFFIVLAFFAPWWMVFYGVPLIILGLVLLLNKHEDKIEERKDIKEKRYRK